jgi:predicted kinase
MVIVITGPIASGKSTVARALHRELVAQGVSAAVIDLDILEDMLTADGPRPDLATWTLARRAAGRLASGFLADGVAVVIADGSYNLADDRATFERHLDPAVRPLYVALEVTYAEALRRAQGDPTRGVSRDPDFLGPYFQAATDASADRPASDLVFDTETVPAMDIAAAIARTVRGR